ncbi:MAG: hypothetical protein WD208_13470 [Dehalococcoidia bacterium]
MTLRYFALSVGALATLMLFAVGCTANTQGSAPLRVVLSVPSDVNADGSLEVKLIVTNTTDGPVRYSPDDELIIPAGSESDPGAELRSLMFRADFFWSFELGSGQSKTHEAIWDISSDIFGIHRLEPGSYSISSAVLLVPTRDHAEPRIESNLVQLVVK